MQHLGVPLHRGEIADAAPGVHLLHQAVADPRAKPRPPLVLPLLEPGRGGHLEAVEKRSPDLQVAGIQMRHVGIHRALSKRHRRPLDHQVLAPHLLFQYGERLCQRVARQMCGSVAPQQVHQVVARESPPRLDGETNQQREVLARAEADLLTRRCEQQERRAERGKVQVRRQKDGSPCFGMGLLDARINVLSTRSESAG